MIECITQPQSQICTNLVVSAAARMQLSPNISELINQFLFDVHVDIFERYRSGKFAVIDRLLNFQQRRFDAGSFVAGEYTHVSKHIGMSNGALNVVRIQTLVEAHAFGELLNTFISGGVKYSGS